MKALPPALKRETGFVRALTSFMWALITIALVFTASLFAAERQWCDVITVHDGDTFTAFCGDKSVRIRVSSIDAPELGQMWGPAAKTFAKELLGERIAVERVDRDQYGRIVAKVETSDGRDLGREMVRAGFAFHYPEYSRDPELPKLEAEAKAANRGIWSFGGSERPSEFRMSVRTKRAVTRRSARRPN